ncbi:hypothetical protein DVW12_17300 [Clostridium botulinum]|uniref:Uncharacterized protein n=1 Tax=Clostridium botulinum TaxID=1491 RepID=A0A126JHY6_CLOBO|nr:hypothetical protein [Clostridium botulinum]MBN1040433.1 hypothetical protein [Clostridium botulinum]
MNRDKDILGNLIYSQYCIFKKNKSLFLKFEKRTATKQIYQSIFTIESIKAIKNSSNGKIVLPNFISQGDILKGKYKEGFSFEFDNILSIEIKGR